MKHKQFNREIIIGPKRFRFYADETETLMYVIYIKKDGYHLRMMTDDGETEVEKHTKLSLVKLNPLLPDDMQLSNHDIIYILVADLEEGSY